MSRLLRFHKLNVPIYTSYLPSSTFVTLDSNSNNRRITSLQFTLQNTQSKRLLCTSCPNSEKKSKFKYLYTDKDGKQHENHDAKGVFIIHRVIWTTLQKFEREDFQKMKTLFPPQTSPFLQNLRNPKILPIRSRQHPRHKTSRRYHPLQRPQSSFPSRILHLLRFRIFR